MTWGTGQLWIGVNQQWQCNEMSVLTEGWVKCFGVGCVGKVQPGGSRKASERKRGVSLFLEEEKFAQAKKQKKAFSAKRTVKAVGV